MDPVNPKPRLQEQFRAVIRAHHYSIRTEKSYWYWIRFFLRFNNMRHPIEMGPREVNTFLSWLATERQVAPATPKLTLYAIALLKNRVRRQQLSLWLGASKDGGLRVHL